MTSEQKAAFLNAAVARALIRALGMQAENMQRHYRGEAMAFVQGDFDNLTLEEGIEHNAIIGLLNG
jgi:hypothetical protein